VALFPIYFLSLLLYSNKEREHLQRHQYLIFCTNVLIYEDPAGRDRCLSLFHLSPVARSPISPQLVFVGATPTPPHLGGPVRGALFVRVVSHLRIQNFCGLGFFLGKSIKWPPKLSTICNLALQSFNWYKITPKLLIPYKMPPSVR
jgi:hypothetical protein